MAARDDIRTPPVVGAAVKLSLVCAALSLLLVVSGHLRQRPGYDGELRTAGPSTTSSTTRTTLDPSLLEFDPLPLPPGTSETIPPPGDPAPPPAPPSRGGGGTASPSPTSPPATSRPRSTSPTTAGQATPTTAAPSDPGAASARDEAALGDRRYRITGVFAYFSKEDPCKNLCAVIQLDSDKGGVPSNVRVDKMFVQSAAGTRDFAQTLWDTGWTPPRAEGSGGPKSPAGAEVRIIARVVNSDGAAVYIRSEPTQIEDQA